MANLLREDPTNLIAPWSPVDYVLRWAGLPRLNPIIEFVSPQRVISEVLGLPTPNDLLETGFQRVAGGLPRLPMPKF